MDTRYPFSPFPAGWFHAAYSDELPAGGVLPLTRFGKEVVLFRAQDGSPAMLDAHCPHLGAHLGYGGKVEGGAIRCPFHGWKYSADGLCVETPQAPKKRVQARVNAWTLREVNGVVLMHHDPKGKKPAFEIPERPECAGGGWSLLERKRWRIRTDLLQPLENLVDASHFLHLHGTPERPRAKVAAAGHAIRSHWDTKLRGPGGRIVSGTLDWEGLGLGYGTMGVAGIARAMLVITAAPVDDEIIDTGIAFWARDGEPVELENAVFRDIVRLIDEDIVIWEHKIYVSKPPLAADEAGIETFRAWARQFLTERLDKPRSEH